MCWILNTEPELINMEALKEASDESTIADLEEQYKYGDFKDGDEFYLIW